MDTGAISSKPNPDEQRKEDDGEGLEKQGEIQNFGEKVNEPTPIETEESKEERRKVEKEERRKKLEDIKRRYENLSERASEERMQREEERIVGKAQIPKWRTEDEQMSLQREWTLEEKRKRKRLGESLK